MYKRQSGGWMKHYDFILIDLLCLHLSFVLSYIIRHGWSNPYTNPLYSNMAIFVTLADLSSILLFGTYSGVLRRRWKKGLIALFRHTATVFLLSVLYLFSTQEGDMYSRITLYLMWAIYYGTLFLSVCLWKHMILHSKSDKRRPSVLVVTTSDLAESAAKQLSTYNFTRVRLCGIAIVDRDMVGEEICGIPVVANQDTVKDYVLHEWVDEIFTCFTGINEKQKKLVNQFIVMGVTVHEKLNFRADEMKNKQFIEKMGGFTVLTTSINYATSLQTLIKRLTDIAGGLLGCLFTLLLFPFMAIVVLIYSPGPVIFTQKRVGKNGKVFKIYKFRTMYKNAEEQKEQLKENHPEKSDLLFKAEFDPRIFGNTIDENGKEHYGIGHKIRKACLDEFPQFFNVLKGDMSLVGTRPPTLDEWNKYKLHHRARLAIKPGITGKWQISNEKDVKDEKDFDKVVKLDTEYIKEWSLALDLKILLKTIGVVFRSKGSG